LEVPNGARRKKIKRKKRKNIRWKRRESTSNMSNWRTKKGGGVNARLNHREEVESNKLAKVEGREQIVERGETKKGGSCGGVGTLRHYL